MTTLGPCQQRLGAAAPGWTIVADELLVGGHWDVYLLHETGARVPPGANPHADPEREIERLVEVVR